MKKNLKITITSILGGLSERRNLTAAVGAINPDSFGNKRLIISIYTNA